MRVIILLLLLLQVSYVEGIRSCGTIEPSDNEKYMAEIQFEEYLLQTFGGYDQLLLAREQVVVEAYWHVIHNDDNEGRLTQEQIEDSMRVLNEDFANSGSTFFFSLRETSYHNNATWFMDQQVRLMARELHVGDCSTLNIYSNGMTNLLGYAAFLPEWTRHSCQNSRYVADGVYINYKTIPGGSEEHYNLGKTLVHEVGHWMGLYHTFAGTDCDGSGDYVRDTPVQSIPTDGCPSTPPDTCPGIGGDDLIENYMDYSYDECYEFFTKGQVYRMLGQYNAYRIHGRGNMPTQAPNDNNPAPCFSPHATAMVQNKGRVSMKDLVVGDRVLTASGQYQTVYTINHFHPTKPTHFLQIQTNLVEEKPIELSAMHLVYIQGNDHPIPAMEVQVGDSLQTLQYGPQTVAGIQLVERNGLYNPITTDGTMLVDGIIASSYTSFTGSAHLEIAGIKIISVHNLLDMTIAPYRDFCMTTLALNVNICNQHAEGELPTVVQWTSKFYYDFFSQQYTLVQFFIITIYLSFFGLIQVLSLLLLSKCSVLLIAASAMVVCCVIKWRKVKRCHAKMS